MYKWVDRESILHLTNIDGIRVSELKCDYESYKIVWDAIRKLGIDGVKFNLRPLDTTTGTKNHKIIKILLDEYNICSSEAMSFSYPVCINGLKDYRSFYVQIYQDYKINLSYGNHYDSHIFIETNIYDLHWRLEDIIKTYENKSYVKTTIHSSICNEELCIVDPCYVVHISSKKLSFPDSDFKESDLNIYSRVNKQAIVGNGYLNTSEMIAIINIVRFLGYKIHTFEFSNMCRYFYREWMDSQDNIRYKLSI